MQGIKKWHVAFFIVFAILFVGLKIWQYRWTNVTVGLKGEELTVLLARTDRQRLKGLGDRDDLGKYQGMLFLHQFPDRYAMVMRDMEFPIDIVWLFEGKVVDIAKNLAPEDVPEEKLTRYYPRAEADMVLELPAGWAESHSLRIGDNLEVVHK